LELALRQSTFTPHLPGRLDAVQLA
jgi:hypothetical protein